MKKQIIISNKDDLINSPNRFFKIKPFMIKEAREVKDLKASWLSCIGSNPAVEGRPLKAGDFVVRDPSNKKDCRPVSLNYIFTHYVRMK